jgi:NTP pyrophosphatase (non-canonical NTP hydrolase)
MNKLENKISSLNEYQELASRTCTDLGRKKLNNLHMKMGLITELAEAIDVYKKKIAYKKDIDYVNLQEELIGDTLFYAVNYCRINDIKLPKLKEGISATDGFDDVDYVILLFRLIDLAIKPKKNIQNIIQTIYVISVYLDFFYIYFKSFFN